MNKRPLLPVLALLLLCAGAVSGLSLTDAIEQSAKDIAGKIPPKGRVAIVAFESPNDNLSDYIMEELTGALFDQGIEIADRRNMDYVFKELHFQMSGEVSEKDAQSIGKFLAAQLVITGQLISQGGPYRYRISAIHVEQATLASSTRLDVENDRAMRNLVTAMAKQTTTVRTVKYGVSEQTTPQTAGTFIDRGILFASRGDYEKAIADFDEALRLDPNLVAAYMLRGMALLASVSYVDEIRGNFEEVITISTYDQQVSARQAQIYDQAIENYTQAIRLDQNNALAYRRRGKVYELKGDNDRALADYNQAIRLNPNNAVAYTGRGLVYENKGDYDRAIADYNEAIRLNPNEAISYSERGNAYLHKGDYDRAIADQNQAIRLNPNDAVAYHNRAAAYGSKKDYDRAIADVNQAIRLGLNHPTVYYLRGRAYSEKKDYDRAIADYTQAIKLDPTYADAYYSRGLAYDNKDDYDRAIADYTQAIKLNPNSARAYNNRGNAYADKKDYDRAIADYTQAIRLDPTTYTVAYFDRGNAYVGKKDYDRAIADYTQAIKLDPNFAAAYYNRGLVYGDYKKDYNRAIADYEAALRIDPNFARAKTNLEAARKARRR